MDSQTTQTVQNTNQSTEMDEFTKLKTQIASPDLPSDLADKLNIQLGRVEKAVTSQGYKMEYDADLRYLDFVSKLPFSKTSQDILDLHRASQILDKNHYGLRNVKDRILEYLSILILNSRQQVQIRSQILAFVGLVGSGKTSLAYSIAEALGRKLIRIPFGGLGSVKELRGESHTRPEAEPGRLLKSIYDEQVNNPIILLDEIDRVASETRADVMGVLVELLDPEQNFAFLDHYVDYPFNLSRALFIATANNTGNIATAVMDRLEIIEMPSYTDEEKIAIGRDYIIPKAIKEAGLPANMITIDDTLWPQIVRPLGYDAGIRSLQRNIQGIVRKVARKIVEGNPGPYKLDSSNIGQYIS
ncbi:AAA family ATPase [Patescibacteria group bacterium]|nr:AAA family ATPase [Patescibacteria group bacterium]MCL5410034.1 AAA family ATPase [Patescibacteria group bacterium]